MSRKYERELQRLATFVHPFTCELTGQSHDKGECDAWVHDLWTWSCPYPINLDQENCGNPGCNNSFLGGGLAEWGKEPRHLESLTRDDIKEQADEQFMEDQRWMQDKWPVRVDGGVVVCIQCASKDIRAHAAGTAKYTTYTKMTYTRPRELGGPPARPPKRQHEEQK